jgi:hypothetical protein
MIFFLYEASRKAEKGVCWASVQQASFFPCKGDAQGGNIVPPVPAISMDLFISFHIRNIKLGKIKTFRELRSSIYFYWF